MTLLALAMITVGAFFMFAASLGLVRLPDFYTRLHAMGKCDTLGTMLVLGGVALLEGPSRDALKVLTVVGFVFLTSPTAAHALGRAALRSGVEPLEVTEKVH
jgi:multicomponent Na+:H+ antiporter subunit G